MNAEDVIRTDLDDMCRDLDAVFAEMAGTTVLLTGGGGFLGWYLTAAPLAWNRAHPDRAPIRVVSTDVFPRGLPEWLTAMADDPNLEVRTHNATQGLPEGIRPDYVIHAASIASPTFYRQYPIETMDANVLGLRHVLDAAVERKKEGAPFRGILFFSSSEVYGDPDPAFIPTDESYWGRVSFTGPRSCYDESKRYGEALCMAFFRVHGIPIRIARPFNNYGPGLALGDRRVIPDFLRDVMAGRDIVLLSDGSPTRTFCYVADAVCGYYRLLVRGRDGQAYNIGQDSPEISMRDLAERVAEAGRKHLGYTGRVVFQTSKDSDYLTDNPNRRCPMLDKARADLGYDPRIGIDEGLTRYLHWARAQITE